MVASDKGVGEGLVVQNPGATAKKEACVEYHLVSNKMFKNHGSEK